jgi:hypothetical protein
LGAVSAIAGLSCGLSFPTRIIDKAIAKLTAGIAIAKKIFIDKLLFFIKFTKTKTP